MSKSIFVQLDLPKDWKRFQLPEALHSRLQDLLDRQDRDGKLTVKERREAEALVDLTEMLSLMKLRAKIVKSGKLS